MGIQGINARKEGQSTCPWWDSENAHCYTGLFNVGLDRSLRNFCRDLLKQLIIKHNLRLATIHSVDPVNRKLIYLASEGADITDLRRSVLDCSESLSGIAVESRQVTFIDDITRRREDSRFIAYPYLVKLLGLRSMISIPILNVSNINQVLLVLDLYPLPDQDRFGIGEFVRYSDSLALRFETFLHDLCFRFASRSGIEMGRTKKRSPMNIYHVVARVLRQAVEAVSVGIYIERLDGQGVEFQIGIGDEFGAERSAERVHIDEIAYECWASNREFLTVCPRGGDVMWPKELLPPVPGVVETITSTVFVPLRDSTGRAKGVFCCLKGRGTDPGSEALYPFTYEDIAVIEAVGQAFAPQLEILMADLRRRDYMNKLAHELRVPVVAFRAALERVHSECKTKKYEFQYDHFEELSTYCDIMNRLLMELDAVRKSPQEVPIVAEKIHIFSKIIPPAIRFVKPLLRKKGLGQRRIQYTGMQEIPELYLDAGLMTEVVFNLLDNAIKYSHNNPDDFSIEIEARAINSGFEINFRDNGVGICEGWEEKIFEEAFGAPMPTSTTLQVKDWDCGLHARLYLATGALSCCGGRVIRRRLSSIFLKV